HEEYNMDNNAEDNDSYIFELIRNIENEIESKVRDITDDKIKQKKKVSLISLPSPPSLQKFQHTKPYHISQVKVTDKLPIGKVTLYSIFHLFFSNLQLNFIIKNTNYYAIAKSAGNGHEWHSLTIEELLI
ncbi:23304_t:CDS:2, partial [Cetraspora pellucida]